MRLPGCPADLGLDEEWDSRAVRALSFREWSTTKHSVREQPGPPLAWLKTVAAVRDRLKSAHGRLSLNGLAENSSCRERQTQISPWQIGLGSLVLAELAVIYQPAIGIVLSRQVKNQQSICCQVPGLFVIHFGHHEWKEA